MDIRVPDVKERDSSSWIVAVQHRLSCRRELMQGIAMLVSDIDMLKVHQRTGKLRPREVVGGNGGVHAISDGALGRADLAERPKAIERIDERPALRRAENTILGAHKEYREPHMHQDGLICYLLKAAQVMHRTCCHLVSVGRSRTCIMGNGDVPGEETHPYDEREPDEPAPAAL